MSERHLGDAVDELDALDVADLDAGDVDRLTLSGDDGLGGLEVGLELERLLLQDRDAQALVLDDHVAREQRDDQQDEDRDEVAEVLADRRAHQPAPRRGGFDTGSFAAGSVQAFCQLVHSGSACRAAAAPRCPCRPP